MTLDYDELLSSFAFNFNLRRYMEGDDAFAADMVYKVEQSARKGEGLEAQLRQGPVDVAHHDTDTHVDFIIHKCSQAPRLFTWCALTNPMRHIKRTDPIGCIL